MAPRGSALPRLRGAGFGCPPSAQVFAVSCRVEYATVIRTLSLMSMLALIASLLFVGLPVRSASSVTFDGFGYVIGGSGCTSPQQDPGYCGQQSERIRQQQQEQEIPQQEMQRQQQQWEQQQKCQVVPMPGTSPTLSAYQIRCW